MVSIDSSSKVYLNNGLDTEADIDLGRAEYNILAKAAEGVPVFSETHPSESRWYNNNNPILSWPESGSINGYSFILDNKPFTIPDNTLDSIENTYAYENIANGLWYFHIKGLKNNAWGNTGHFMVKIDTAPPAPFTPNLSAILSDRSFVSFFTTDNLSGVDHYEVGTIDTNQPISEAPVFIESNSPFRVPILENSTLKVIVRAFDKAGNTTEGYIEVHPPVKIVSFIKNNITTLLIFFILLVITSNYLIKYGIIKPFRRKSTFSVLEKDINNYLDNKKELNEQNMIEKAKIEILEKDLESIKQEIDQETNEIHNK